MAYARAVKSAGVEIRENVSVSRIETDGNQVEGVSLADGTMLHADQVVISTGAWSRELAATAGVSLPLQAVEHMYVVTEPMENLPDPFPVIRDLDRGNYVKGDAGKLVIGGFEPHAKCWDPYGAEGDRPFLEMPEDWDQFAPFMEAALELIPDLANTGIQHFMNGPESFTADTRPLVGQTPNIDGLFVAAGMNSVGVMSSAGIGRVLADWIVDDVQPMDLWEVDVARADPITADANHMAARMDEAVSDLFAMHWPYKQPKAGRGIRVSALHEQWKNQGAVFGQTAGWERGLWYARQPTEHDVPYSTGDQGWWPIAEREAEQMQSGTALIDLSPFTKIDVSGPSALAGLNRLFTAQLDVPIGRAVYTQLLNAKGGIEMDATVTRLAPDQFEITSGAATWQRDLAYLRRALPNDVILTDLTDLFCVIGVMGQGSRVVLQSLAETWTEIPFGHSTDMNVAGISCRMTRVSFVGTLGWEVRVANEDAAIVFDALTAEKARPLGHYALDGCRIEKGFKHWGHDLGPDITPLEAGLGFTIDWTKEFIGKAALLAQSDAGLTKRLVLMEVDGNALMLHDEPIFENGAWIGLTTSGARGPRTGKNLAFGLIDTNPGEKLSETCARSFEIQVADGRYSARALPRAPYDPTGQEMRA